MEQQKQRLLEIQRILKEMKEASKDDVWDFDLDFLRKLSYAANVSVFADVESVLNALIDLEMPDFK